MAGAVIDTTRPVFLPDPVNRHHPLNRGRVAWWLALPGLAGGRQMYDLMGLHHGTLTGFDSTSGWIAGRNGEASGGIKAKDASSYVDCPSVPSVLNGRTTASLSFWIYRTAGTLSGVGQGITNRWGLLWYADNVIYLTASGGYDFTSAADAVTGWRHVVLTYDGSLASASRFALYLDGMPAALGSVGPSATIPTADGNFQIGGFQNGAYGTYDDVSLWNSTLSASDARAVYDLSRRGYPGVLNRVSSRVMFPLGSSVFNVTPTGGVALAGSGAFAASFAPAPSGALVLGGSATQAAAFPITPAGGLVLSGTSAPALALAPAPSGGVAMGGSAVPALASSPAPAGGVVLGGSAAVSPSFARSPSGGLILGGAAIVSPAFAPVPSGGLVLGGVADVVGGNTFSRTGSGGLTPGGSAVPAVAFAPSLSGGVTLGGSATRTVISLVSPSGGPVLSGTATVVLGSTPASPPLVWPFFRPCLWDDEDAPAVPDRRVLPDWRRTRVAALPGVIDWTRTEVLHLS